MNFNGCSNQRRNLLSVGYEVGPGQLSKSCYDLLASGGAYCNLYCGRQGRCAGGKLVPAGRQHTRCENEYVLLSWTGTMFEYLMAVDLDEITS